MRDMLFRGAVALGVGLWLHYTGAPSWAFVMCIGTQLMVKVNE